MYIVFLHFQSLLLYAFVVASKAAILDSQKPTATVSEGDPGVLMCTATGVPAPTIYWFMNGALLADDGVMIIITNSTDDTMPLLSVTSTLNVTNVMRESAFAIIICSASNGVGANSSDSTQLIVLCKLCVLLVMCVNINLSYKIEAITPNTQLMVLLKLRKCIHTVM